MKTADKPLSPIEQWMVKSNLQTIKDGTPAEELVATLHANGYHRVAAAVEEAVKPKIKSIGWASTKYGYCVQGHDEDGQVNSECDYWAGNSPRCSQTYIDPDQPGAVPADELRRMAEQTAKEMADEHGVSHDDVWEDTDMEEQLREVHEGCG